jgi:hypothetical protein
MHDFVRGPWLPVLCTLLLVGLIALVPGEPVGSLGDTLKGLAAVITALAGLVVAAARYHRK